MKRRLAIGITALALSVHGGAPASMSAISNDSLGADRADGGAQAGPSALSSGTNPVAGAQVVVSPRDRPIFSPSRRPPPPAVTPAEVPKVAAVPIPREPERPQLTLVGTVASDDEGFGIFLDQSTTAVFRLRVGEDYQGWKLRSVQGREATLEKDRQVVPLALPQPSAGQVAIEVLTPPPND
jgi:general secretion pathway protein N